MNSICEKCGVTFDNGDGKYIKRFCSRKCSNSRVNSKETIEKRRISNIKAFENKSEKDRMDFSDKIKKTIPKRMETYENNFMRADFNSLKFGTKKRRVLIEQNKKCLICDNNEWMGNPLVLELDHIDGDNKNNKRDNLRYLCPNCHSQTPTWRGRNNIGILNSKHKKDI